MAAVPKKTDGSEKITDLDLTKSLLDELPQFKDQPRVTLDLPVEAAMTLCNLAFDAPLQGGMRQAGPVSAIIQEARNQIQAQSPTPEPDGQKH